MAINVDGVKLQVKAIQKHFAETGDYEHAHGAEISLWEDVLKTIARQHTSGFSNENYDTLHLVTNLAKEALKTNKIKFKRLTA